MHKHTGLLSALALVLFAGSPAALAGPEEKSKNPIFRAAERAKQSQPAPQPRAAPSRPSEPSRSEPRASSPAPRPSAPAPAATRTTEPSRSPIYRAAERARQSEPAARPTAPAPSQPRASEPSRRTQSPGATPSATPATRPSEPSGNPIFRAAERARATPSQQPRATEPARPSAPRVVPSGSSPEPRWSGTVATDRTGPTVRTGPIRTAEIARQNRTSDPTLGQPGRGSVEIGGASRDRGSQWNHDRGSGGSRPDGRGGSRNDWNGAHDGDRHDRDWNGRDWGRRDWNDHDRSSWSFSLGIGGDGFAIGLGYSSGGYYSRRHYIPCDPWPVHRPMVRRHSHSYSSAWCRPLWVEPVWCGPTYRYRCVPVYSSFAWYASDDWSPWTSSVVVVKQPTIVYDTPSVTTYVNDAPQWVTYDAPVATSVVASEVAGVDGSATVFRGQGDLGQMVWSAVPSSIVDSVLSVGPAGRADTAARFLSRRPAGGWQVIFESQRRVGDIVWVQTRGVTSSQFGTPPTVRLALRGELEGVRAGQQMTVTGRLTEVSVDDPRYPFGVLTLEEADVAQ